MSQQRNFGWVGRAAPAVPYVAVLIGMYLLSSGWAAMLLYHAGVLLVLFSLKEKTDSSALLRGWNMGAATLSIVCLGSGVVLFLLWPIIAADADGSVLTQKLADLGLSGFSWLGFTVYYALVNPWLEELYWRGVLGSKSKRPAASDFLFAGYHVLVLIKFVPWFWALFAAVTLVATAWIWRQIANRYGGLLVPTVAHLAADASIVIAAHIVAFV